MIASAIIVDAQSNIRVNNYWQNPYYINPAAIDEDYTTVFSVAARKQWFGFEGAPGTLFATARTFISPLNTQFGLKVFTDKIGYTNTSNVALSYAYSVMFNRDWRLNFGINASYQNVADNTEDINYDVQSDPSIYMTQLPENNYNCDLGAQFSGKGLNVGISTQNIFSLFFDENISQSNTNYFYAIYHHQSTYPVNLQIGIAAIQYVKMFQMEVNFTTYFDINNQPEVLDLGLFYRTKNEMGAIAGVKLNDTFHLSYSYDFAFTGISRYSVGTHELMLTYKFNKQKYRPQL